MIRLTKYDWLLIVIILASIAMRFNDMMNRGYYGDMLNFNAPWAQDIRYYGLFKIYATSPTTNYPPIFLFILDFTSRIIPPYFDFNLSLEFIILTKLFSVLAEIMLIGIVYVWIPKNTRLKWIIPLLLAVYPGMIMVTAYWGQTDSILTLFLVLSIIAINRNQRRMSWIWCSVAMLMKFQAVVFLPILSILALRRFGLRSALHGFLIGLGVFSVVYAPFVLWSGFDNAMRPYTGAVDYNSVITSNAFNLWFLATPSMWGLLPTDLRVIPTDKSLILNIMTRKQMGLALFGGYLLTIISFMWKHYGEQREFVWATALYLAFFMLPTQIHERYLFPAAVLSLIAIVQDRRMWLIALPLMLSFTGNIVAIPREHFFWFGLDLKTLFYGSEVATAVLSLLCLIGLLWIGASGSNTAGVVGADSHTLQIETR